MENGARATFVLMLNTFFSDTGKFHTDDRYC